MKTNLVKQAWIARDHSRQFRLVEEKDQHEKLLQGVPIQPILHLFLESNGKLRQRHVLCRYLVAGEKMLHV